MARNFHHEQAAQWWFGEPTVALLYNTYLKKIIKETASKDVLNFDFSCMEEPVKKSNNNYLFNNKLLLNKYELIEKLDSRIWVIMIMAIWLRFNSCICLGSVLWRPACMIWSAF